jgi:hypothetical protein
MPQPPPLFVRLLFAQHPQPIVEHLLQDCDRLASRKPGGQRRTWSLEALRAAPPHDRGERADQAAARAPLADPGPDLAAAVRVWNLARTPQRERLSVSIRLRPQKSSVVDRHD